MTITRFATVPEPLEIGTNWASQRPEVSTVLASRAVLVKVVPSHWKPTEVDRSLEVPFRPRTCPLGNSTRPFSSKFMLLGRLVSVPQVAVLIVKISYVDLPVAPNLSLIHISEPTRQ